MEPNLKAFLVSAQWGPARGTVTIHIEYTAEMAAAAVVMSVMRMAEPPTENLTNLMVREIDAVGLRTILMQLETGRPSAPVVSLVPHPAFEQAKAAEPEPPAAAVPEPPWRPSISAFGNLPDDPA